MARDFNQNRFTTAKLGQENITTYGKTFAVQYGLDGFSIVNNVVVPVPTDIKEYLEGNDNITIFACASNIDKLCEYALASFPNIEYLYLFKASVIVVLEDDLSYLLDLTKIYVPSDLLSAYISAYPTLSSKFDTILEDYTLTIPFVGDTTLTSEYVDSVIAMLSSAEKNTITKVVIPTDFTQASADSIAWNYDFSAIVNLNDNIWYGATRYDFTTWTIEGSGTLTSAIVESSIASISSDKLSGVTKLVIGNNLQGFNNGLNTFLDASNYSSLVNLNSITIYSFDSTIGSLFKDKNISNKHLTLNQKVSLNYNGNMNLFYSANNNNSILEMNDFSGLYYLMFWFSLADKIIINNKNVSIDIIDRPNLYAKYIYLLDFKTAEINKIGNSFLLSPAQVNKLYFNYNYLPEAMQNTYLNQYMQKLVGVLDYTDTVPTWTDYSATWYSNEDCTIPIATTDFVSGNRYYVKLTAI